MVAGGQALEEVLGHAVGGAHGEPLGDQRAERGQDAQRGELRWPREVQGAVRPLFVESGLGDLQQRVDVRGDAVGEFVARGGGG
ncbi:hypothetical protein GCM10020221_27950 [Streptomyces thioluteus]|uniref:Uncharacterized protein n=1 Tax=Streptomyces thioluteus TaxID=66431 RepID=A0ABN3X068_STRTU